MHAVDLIRKKRDNEELSEEEIRFLVAGAARGTIPEEQLSAWLMAAWLRGLSLAELNALTAAMRFSGRTLTHPAGKRAVDKHSTGGVGDKTSLLVAPIAAAGGVLVPMISGRALGHTGGTLDKLESIPGFRTQLSLKEIEAELSSIGASMVGQTEDLVPADRVLYALRDRTGTVESPYLICASIMSKKLAEGLDGLVLDVKHGSGAFLKRKEDALYLAALMVNTGEAAGTRTTALLSSMDQPLGRYAGNWVEVAESLELLRGKRHPLNEDLRELSLRLAGWMLHLGERAESAEAGYRLAETLLTDGKALQAFERIVSAQGGDVEALQPSAHGHAAKVKRELRATRSGVIAGMDCSRVGWAVQRLGAGRERAGEPVQAHAGLEFHAKVGSTVRAGEAICTLFSDDESRFNEPERLLCAAITIQETLGEVPALLDTVVTAANADEYLQHDWRPLR